MRIHLISDLHMEFGREPELHTPDCDLVVLAGDIHGGARGVTWAAQKFGRTPVVYVPGNHEFYRGIRTEVLHDMNVASVGTNVMVLNNRTANIDGVRFIGATLWTDYDLWGDPEQFMQVAERGMNDHRWIMNTDCSKFMPIDARSEHMISREYILHRLEEPFDGKTVVVTHHAPSMFSVHRRYKQDRLTAAFASNLDTLISMYQPVLWLHGHMHDACDYNIGMTNVVCNPMGYPSEQGQNGFCKDLVLEFET